VLIDHYFTEQDWKRAFEAIGVVEARVGSDGLTELLRANVYASQGENEQALAQIRAAVEREPDFEDAYLSLLTLYAAQGQFQEAVGVLEQVRSRFGYALAADELAEEEIFAELVQSEAFKTWSAAPPAVGAGAAEPEAR